MQQISYLDNCSTCNKRTRHIDKVCQRCIKIEQGWRVLTKEELERDRCSAYEYLVI